MCGAAILCKASAAQIADEEGQAAFQHLYLIALDTWPSDSSIAPRRRAAPAPRKAFLYSLILPGAGQVYNGHWWKVPFVYAAVGGAAVVAINSQKNYSLFQEAYFNKVNSLPLPGGIPPAFDDARTLRVIRDRYDRRRQSWYVYTAAAYALQAVEALVDAHLQGFDISEDLSLHLHPGLIPVGNGSIAPGIGIALRLQ